MTDEIICMLSIRFLGGWCYLALTRSAHKLNFKIIDYMVRRLYVMFMLNRSCSESRTFPGNGINILVSAWCLVYLARQSATMMTSASMPWWRHQMETFSALLAPCVWNSPVTGEFPSQRPVTRSFDVFFYLCLNKRLSKQSWGRWFETLPCPLWRHCNAVGFKLSARVEKIQ